MPESIKYTVAVLLRDSEAGEHRETYTVGAVSVEDAITDAIIKAERDFPADTVMNANLTE